MKSKEKERKENKETNKALKGERELLLVLINASRMYYDEKRLQSSHLNQRPWETRDSIPKTCYRMIRIEELGAGALELGSWLGNNIIPSMREGACKKRESVGGLDSSNINLI